MSGSINKLFDSSVVGAPQNQLAPQPTWADAWQFNAQAAQAELERQRATTPEQAPMISDETMAELLKRLLIAGTGGYNDTPLPEPSPYEPLFPPSVDKGPGPIPNMTLEEFQKGFDRNPRDVWDRWLQSKFAPKEADI